MFGNTIDESLGMKTQCLDGKKTPSWMTLTVPEAAKKLGIGRNTAYLAARAGDIPTIRINDRILVLKAAFEKLLEGNG